MPRSARAVSLAVLIGAAALVLVVGDGFLGPLASGLSVAGAIAAVWIAGGAPGRAGRWSSGAFLLTLGGGVAAAGAGSAIRPMGLPLGLWGLLFGVFLLPLLLTTVGFAVAFRAPDPEGLTRLRAAARRASR